LPYGKKRESLSRHGAGQKNRWVIAPPNLKGNVVQLLDEHISEDLRGVKEPL